MGGFDALDWFLAAIFGLISIISLSVKFDLNEWLKERRRIKEKRLQRQLREACPHAYILKGKHITQFIPQNDGAWKCEGCGKVTYDGNFVKNIPNHWNNNPKEYMRAHEEYQKLIKKFNRI